MQPFYVRTQVVWEQAELSAVRRYLQALTPHGRLHDLVVFDLPLTDLYGNHWSLTGRDPPGAETDDEAVYLPGRNAILLLKPVLWCQLHGLERVAIGTLGSNPFADATDAFFHAYESALSCEGDSPVRLLRPLAGMDKRRVMELGRCLPLELTFSCIAPQGRQHCGTCNKCAERQAAFRESGMTDSTRYANRL